MNIETQMPTLSIVVNNYNYAQFLPEALDSALTQLSPADELIVVDDGSTDQSLEILQDYAEQHGVTVVTQTNSGQLQAVGQGLEEASNEVIVLLDSDDYFLPGYLDRLRNIYGNNPAVNYVFAKARPFGQDASTVAATNENLDKMALPQGAVGPTRWSTQLFQEYVGVPTSGNSLRRALAQDVMPMLNSLNRPLTLSPWLARILGVSSTETNRPGQSADGALIRCCSLLGAQKYYDDSDGFMYRIHTSNKYAGSSRSGRRYLRHLRKKQFARFAQAQPALEKRATTQDILTEVMQRSMATNAQRRSVIKLLYCRSILTSQGKAMEKLAALGRITQA